MSADSASENKLSGWDTGQIEGIDRQRLTRLAARICGDHDSAQDIVSEVFSRIPALSAAYRGEAKFSSYLYRVTLNRAIDELRKKKRQAALIETNGIAICGSAGGEFIPERDIALTVRSAITELDELFRQPLVLVELEKYSYADAAEELGIPLATLRTRVYRARRKLLDIFKQKKITL